jgi:lysophospholipase L1-like esterase
MSTTRRLGTRIGLRILVTLVSTAVLLGTLEGGARLIRARSAPATELEWLEYSDSIGWRSRPGTHDRSFGPQRQFDGGGLLAEDSRGVTPEGRRGKRLILLLGDSRTFGNGVSADETYGRVLERRVPGVVVINRAFPGYSSLQGVIALKADAPRFRPDIAVFAFDFNDRRYALHPWEVDGPDRFQRLARLASWDRLARSVALVDLAMGHRAPGPDRGENRSLDLGTVRPRVSPSDFRQNLEAAARYCSEHGIELILLTLNDNIAHSRELEEGARAWRAGRVGDAEDMWRIAVARSNVFSDAARLQLSGLYERTGRPGQAATVRLSPRTFHSVAGGFPIHPGGEYRAIVRDVAESAGVRIAAAGSEIDRDPARYLDFCHFNRDGHRIVAGVLTEALFRDARASGTTGALVSPGGTGPRPERR